MVVTCYCRLSLLFGVHAYISHTYTTMRHKCASEKQTLLIDTLINVHGDLVILNVMQLVSQIAHPTAMLWLPTDGFVNVKIRQKILFLESLEF